MKVALAADHAGFELKNRIAGFIAELGHEAKDLGAYNTDPSDYPDLAEKVGRAVVGDEADRGVLICGSGIGAAIAANKLPGIRAGTCHDTYSARQGVEHDDMNVLVVGSRIIGIELAREVVRTFLAAAYTGEERHRRRLAKVRDLEKRCRSGSGDGRPGS